MDQTLKDLLTAEADRQETTFTLIPSENYTSASVREALSSVATNKYSEGYPGRRYYNGNKFIDQIEDLARERTKKVFKAQFANVQPYSGSPANLAVYFSLVQPGDTIMGIALSHGGHLTHGADVSLTGKWFKSIKIAVEEDGTIDYAKVRAQALEAKPKLIIAGITAYPREINYTELSKIAKEVGAYLVADISHTNGLVIAGLHKNPLAEGADIITSTTHKLLRGPRGAIIVTNNSELATKIDKAIMPGLQGGPHNHQTAAIAVAMLEADKPTYKEYVQQVAKNAQEMAKVFVDAGITLVSGGTDNHLLLLDLRNLNISGKEAADLLEEANIVVNANSIPNDPNPPLRPSGIRVGTPALTTRGLKEAETVMLAGWIVKLLKKEAVAADVKAEVLKLAKQFPIPSNF